MNRRDAVLTIPAAIAAVASKPPAAVTQEELRRVGSLWNEAELLAANIRGRLLAGASLEPSELGVSTWGNHAVAGVGGGSSISIGGIDIEPAEHIRRERNEFPQLAHEMWVS